MSEIGSDEWASERLTDYTEKALTILALVTEYEDVHPAGAPCFTDALEQMKAVFA